MKKTLIALIGALLLLGIVLLLDQRRESSRHADRFTFDTTRKADVSSLKVILQRDTAVLVKLNGQWVTASDSFPVDTAKINKGLSYLLSLQSKEIVSTNPSRPAEYGMDTAQAKHLEWRLGEQTVRLVLGKTSGIDYGSTYWKWEDKSEVFSTPGNFTWEIPARAADWKDRSLFKLDPKELKQVEVDWRDSADAVTHYKLEIVNDSTNRMVEPESSTVIKNVAASIVSQCGQLSIDDFVAPGDTGLSRARLDTPMVLIRLTLKNGKSLELKGGRTFDTYMYVQHPSRKDVVKLSTWRFDPFKKKPGAISGRDTIPVMGPTAKPEKSKKH